MMVYRSCGSSNRFFKNREQRVDTDCDPDLGLDRVLVQAEDALHPQMALETAEQQLDQPAVAVQVGDGPCGQLEVVAEEVERTLLVGVAEGGGTGSLVESAVEFHECDRGLGSEQGEQQVGRAVGQVDSVSPEAGV